MDRAAYIEPGQLISHVLNSGDTDWFCFTVPEDHMTLHVSSDCAGVFAGVYTGRDLAEYGESANIIWSGPYKSANNLYWKLDEKGLYYIKLDGGSSEKICSTTISLIPPEAIEDNDTWYRATPLYEEFTQAFDISAENDSEWFRFTVPQGSQKAVLLNISVIESGRGWSDFSLYRKAYFDGQDDERIQWWDSFLGSTKQTYELEPGIYYLEVSARSFGDRQKLSICYKLVPQLDNDVIATAAPLTERVWQDVWKAGYFSIGERKAGEVVQIQLDDGGNTPKDHIYVYDADGKYMKDSYYASFSFQVSADGVYYLKVPEYDVNLNAENEPMRPIRIRYYTHNDKIGAAESIAMRPNESVFLDLWFSPEIRNSLKVESEDEALTYDLETGYLTAPNTPDGHAELVFSNGYSEGNEKRVEAVVRVTWSEKLLSDISISNAPQSLSVGSSAQLEAAVTPDDYIGRVSWESSDTTVLRVLSNGKVVAVGQGEAVITASVGECTSSVTITVTEDTKSHKLAASVAYSNGKASEKSILFQNTYQPEDVLVELSAKKNLTGRELQAYEFEFELVDDKGNVIDSEKNDKQGNIQFKPLTYGRDNDGVDDCGEYRYVIREKNTGEKNVTYDKTEHHVTVTVSDNLQGNLTAKVQYDPTDDTAKDSSTMPVMPTAKADKTDGDAGEDENNPTTTPSMVTTTGTQPEFANSPKPV